MKPDAQFKLGLKCINGKLRCGLQRTLAEHFVDTTQKKMFGSDICCKQIVTLFSSKGMGIDRD